MHNNFNPINFFEFYDLSIRFSICCLNISDLKLVRLITLALLISACAKVSKFLADMISKSLEIVKINLVH